MKRHQPYHIYLDNTVYFITARIYHKQLILNIDLRKKILLRKIIEEFCKYQYKLFAWVILNDHYHILFKTQQGNKLPQIFKAIHGNLSFEFNRQDNKQGRKIFQNYFDVCIRDKKKFFIHLNYIHHNPIKHGYVTKMDQYVFSSYNVYSKKYGRGWLTSTFEKYPIFDYSLE